MQRREPYQADGLHKLWMRCGGSVGHASLFAVDIDEGVYDPDEIEGGRQWGVSLRTVTIMFRSEAVAKFSSQSAPASVGPTSERLALAVTSG